MKIISYNAISINGIIAREDYTEDFLSDLDWKIFCHLSKKYKCLIISKKSYDLIKKLEDLNFLNIKNIDKLINEIILNIDPVMVSKGINLFQQDKFEVKLKLLKNKRLKKGIIQLNYRVNYKK